VIEAIRSVGHITVAHLGDWVQPGKILALIAAKHDFEQVGKSCLTNDAVMAISAGRLGITVVNCKWP